MSVPPQVAPSEFDFKVPKVVATKKFSNKEKEKQIDKRPFFGGFSKDTRNMQSTHYKNEESKVAVRAGGYNPESRQTQRKRFDKNMQKAGAGGLIASGIQVGSNPPEANQPSFGMNQYENINKFLKHDAKKKKTTPGGGGFRINIKKKKKHTDNFNKNKLKSLDCDIHDRWVADPIVKEVLEKHEANIKKAGHLYNDKPIPNIIPKENIKKVAEKKVHKIEAPKFEESFNERRSIPEMRSLKHNEDLDFEDDSDAIPTSKIENVLNKYAKEIEEDEQTYKQKLEEHYQKEESKKDELKAITDNAIKKRPIMQTNFEPVRPLQSEPKTRPNTEDDWLYEYRKEEFYDQRNKEMQEKSEHHKKEQMNDVF